MKSTMRRGTNIERVSCVQTDVRRPVADEFASMAALAVRAWLTAAPDIELTTERQEALEMEFQRDLLENANGVLAAYIGGTCTGWGARVPKSNYISDLWIDPPYQGQGFGSCILDALMAQIMLDGFNEARIGTHANNLTAIHLYKNMGFKIDWRGEEWSKSFGRSVEKVWMCAAL